MKTYNTKVGTSAYFKRRSWVAPCVLFFQEDEIDYKYARLTDERRKSVDYHSHPDKGELEDGTMLTCVSKPYSGEVGQSVWVVTDPKSKHFGKQTILNGAWYSVHTTPARGRVGYPPLTHYNLVETVSEK